MNHLKEFLASMTIDERQTFAAQCRTSWPFLRNVAYGYRTPGEKLCVAIEKASDAAITRQMLRPDDWAEIWPELAAGPTTVEAAHG